MTLTGRTIYDWVSDFMERAQDEGDLERERLWALHVESWTLMETEPERALSLIEEGHNLAQTLGEAWWVIFFVQRRVSFLLYYKRDYRAGLDAAVRAVVEARRPIYNGCPQQLLLHIALISAYIQVDAVGYRATIEDALEFVSSQKELCDDHVFVTQILRVGLELELEHWDKAHQEAQLYFDLASQATLDLEHYVGSAYGLLCLTSYRLNDWSQLGEHARDGEIYTRREDRRALTAALQMWQSLALHHEGEVEESKRLSRLAAARMTRLASPPADDYFEAYAAVREARGQWREALKVRDHELSLLENQGRHSASANCHFERCRLLSETGNLTRGDVENARQAMLQLIDPKPMLAKLNLLRINNEPEA